MTVIAPKGGYDFAEKRQYRRHVWNTIARTSFIDPKRAQIMLMPSREGDEIDAAKAKGFRVANMHVVDDTPAVIANLRRRDYGAFTGYGRTAADACRHAASQGVRLDAANFDFTSCMGDGLEEELYDIATSRVFRPSCVIGITMQRGREHPRTTARLMESVEHMASTGGPVRPLKNWHHTGFPLADRDHARLARALTTLVLGLNTLGAYYRSGTYKSDHVTMLWAVATFQADWGPPSVDSSLLERTSYFRHMRRESDV